MARRTHSAAVEFALEQELFEKGEKLHHDKDHRRAFHSRAKLYLGSVIRGERTVHYWWIYSDEELMTIDEGSSGVVVSGNLENPLKRIPTKKMTIEELEVAGEFNIPPSIMRMESYLSEMDASVGALEHKACDVLLPLLGIEIVPESDADYVGFENIDWGIVRFHRK